MPDEAGTAHWLGVTMENMETVITRRRPEREETPDLIPGYFARIGKGDLLTHEEEIGSPGRFSGAIPSGMVVSPPTALWLDSGVR